MSYEGMRGDCPHEGGREYNPNCRRCVLDRAEGRGVRDERGVLHAPNGGGADAYCIGHIEKDPRYPDGDGRCTVLIRHCPVLNTPEQVAANLREDRALAVEAAEREVSRARRRLAEAEEVLMARVREQTDAGDDVLGVDQVGSRSG